MGSCQSRKPAPQWWVAERSETRLGLSVVLILLSFNVLAEDLDLPEDQIRAGRSLYLKSCAKCHGKDASGGSAPDVQGMLLKDVKDAARGVEAMREIALSDEEAGDIAVFLMSLAPDQARLRLGKN